MFILLQPLADSLKKKKFTSSGTVLVHTYFVYISSDQHTFSLVNVVGWKINFIAIAVGCISQEMECKIGDDLARSHLGSVLWISTQVERK